MKRRGIKAAAQAYAHGASLGKAADLTGAGKQELSEYIGVTRLSEKYPSMDVRKRLEVARRIFE
ncbi:TPA: hypothetical protein HA318_03570 [Candidatus Micrarchaeota archaeon]|nr:MAG: hypothetical protein AUJ65_03605 [Candidatus Micrarchaeota archaeon CG1_02_51_15]HII39053.1 hypothetical protein [Candidatus Micrarchaeota archaeon]